MRDVDVVVVGCGVAGAAAALHLAARGYAVLAVDRGTYPREKVCGEGLMPHGVAELDALGLGAALRATGARPFRGIAYHVGGADAVGTFAEGTGLGVRRLKLDALLFEACGRAGVEVWTDTRVDDVRVTADGVEVSTAEGPIRARAIVGADGRGSKVRRALGLEVRARGPHRYGVRVHLALAPGVRERDVVDVYVHGDAEVYVTPTGPGEVNVALLCGREVTRSLGDDPTARVLEIARRAPDLAALLDGASTRTPAGVCGPLRRSVKAVYAERAVLVGDAAGFVDAITGEGMSIGLVSARLAADSLHAALAADVWGARALAPYGAARRAATRDQIALTELVLWGFRRPWLARHIVGNLGRHPELFGRMLSVNSGSAGLLHVGARGVARLLVG